MKKQLKGAELFDAIEIDHIANFIHEELEKQDNGEITVFFNECNAKYKKRITELAKKIRLVFVLPERMRRYIETQKQILKLKNKIKKLNRRFESQME